MSERPLLIAPVPALDRLPQYSVGRPPFKTDLILDFNESLEPLPISSGAPTASKANLYPWTEQLEAQLADRLGIEANRVIVTCGADDALERSVRSVCCPGRRAVMIKPTYGMPWRYAITTGAEIDTVEWWEGSFPVDEVCETAADAALLFLVSPNNPTGAVITRDEFTEVVTRLPRTLILHDQAYREFSDPEFDHTKTALTHPNVVLVRTFSKAWGGAGLRAGYAAGDERVIDWLRRIGQPFPVSRLTLDVLEAVVTPGAGPSRERIDRIRSQRESLAGLLTDLGAEVLPSQASFVAARFGNAAWVRNAMASLGIAIRGFPGRSELNNLLRTTMPGDDGNFKRLTAAFRTVLRPEAILVESDDDRPGFEILASDTTTPGSGTVAPDRLSDLSAWVVCRKPETIRPAREAACLPLGLLNPESGSSRTRKALENAGAARVLDSIEEIVELPGVPGT